MQITANWSRPKPEVEFQYGGRLYLGTGSNYISAANRGISTKFGLLIRLWPSEGSDINKYETATAKYYFRFRVCWCHCLQKVKVLSANQISSTYLNWRLRYNHFRFCKTNVHHIGNLLSVSISTIWPKSPHYSATEFRPNRSTHCRKMTSYAFLKTAAATAEYYFRFRICWRNCWNE